MTAEELVQHVARQFGPKLIALPQDKHPRVELASPADWPALADFLVRDPAIQLDWLANLSGIDYAADEKMAVVYDLWSFHLRHGMAVKVFCPRGQPKLPSVTSLWPAANWHEREAYDLLGIVFDGHPNLCRILLEDDWVGHPLRKDYQFPREVHGIPGSVELDWQQKPDYPK
jgi:NADH-quinone oxidoreductase subunit C